MAYDEGIDRRIGKVVNGWRGLTSKKMFGGVCFLLDGNNNITLVDDTNTGIPLTNSGLRFEAPGGNSFYVNYRKLYCSRICYVIARNNIVIDKFDILNNDWKSILTKTLKN